ncbi:hypothetical protein P4V41_07575 [Fictibacillus nanhaiensis]|uniref:hypothetical protein n=1 Tax=Fictibacillus nanhaiensis TaxID=742169 RepID=UPI002E1BC806|nr:hypothetical protein [Fictibacillus nanhaiensis]
MITKMSIILMVWLSVGFIVSLKFIYIDKKFNSNFFEKARNRINASKEDEVFAIVFNLFTKSKMTFIAAITLLGIIPMILDLLATFKKQER